MSLAELGELLRQSREERSLSVDEIASILKINPRLIRNIESGNHAALPHAVYVRGFIKTYAKMLGIEPDAVESGLSEFAPPESEIPGHSFPAPSRLRHSAALKILVLLCVLGFAGYWFMTTRGMSLSDFSFENIGRQLHALRPENKVPATRAPALPAYVGQIEEEQRGAAQVAQSPQTSPVMQSAASSAPPASTVLSEEVRTELTPPDAPDEVVFSQQQQPDAMPAAPVSSEPLPEDVQTLTAGFTLPESGLPEHGDGKGRVAAAGFHSDDASRQIILSGMKDGVIDFEADGTDARRHIIIPGEVFSLSFRTSLTLTVNDPSSIMMRVNDRMVPVEGRAGSPLTLVFPLREEDS